MDLLIAATAHAHGARLYDANLSPALVALLRADYPDSIHVRDVGLRQGSDADIWEPATTNTMVVVSKDTDFRERAFVDGPPRQVLWIDVGNAGTRAIEHYSAARSLESSN